MFSRIKMPVYPSRLFQAFCQGHNHYEVLEISPNASFQQIKQQYRSKSKIFHPDISANSPDRYHQIQKAYKTLVDPALRKKYDLSLGIRSSQWQRQLNSVFNQAFESRVYDQILKQEDMTVIVSNLSASQKLQLKYRQQIHNFQKGHLLSNFTFLASVAAAGVLWVGWNVLEMFVLNYRGGQRHNIILGSGDKTLKALPTFTR